MWTETPTGGTPNFLTGAGGFLQTAFSGYPGLRVNVSGCFLESPSLPQGTATVGIRGVSFLGSRFSFSYGPATITFVAEAADAERVDDATSAVTRYAHACDFAPVADASACRRGLAEHAHRTSPMRSVAERAQWGRVRLADGHVVAQRDLVVVDSAGGRYPLVPGAPVTLPLQSCSVQAALAARV